MAKVSWDTIKKEHPDKWVALIDVETDEGSIKSANVIDECSDDKLSNMKKKYRAENSDHHIWFARTAEGSIPDFIHLLNASCDMT